MAKSLIDVWANFLMNEKLDATHVADQENLMVLVFLAEECAKVRGPRIDMHKHKLESRRFLVATAMSLGIDLPAITNKRGKVAMSRGLLDAWNKEYVARFGSNVGTDSEWEAKRRDVKTRLSKKPPV